MEAITGAATLFLVVVLIMFTLGSFTGTKLILFIGWMVGGVLIFLLFTCICIYIGEVSENRKKNRGIKREREKNLKISDDLAGDKSQNSGQKLGYKPRDKAKDRLF